MPHDAPVLEKAINARIREEAEVTGVRKLFGKTGSRVQCVCVFLFIEWM